MAQRDYSDYYNSLEGEIDSGSSGSLAPFTFICVVVILVMTGLVMLYSSSYAEATMNGLDHYYYVLRQGIFAILGFVCAIVINLVPAKWIRLAAIPLVVIALVSMLMTLFTPYGVTVMGARRWLALPLVPQFQPSEVVKLSTIVFLAWWLTSPSTRRYLGWYYVVPFIMIVGFTLLIVVQRAYTTSIHYLILALAICVAARLKLRYIFIACAFISVPGILYMLSESYRVKSKLRLSIPGSAGAELAGEHVARCDRGGRAYRKGDRKRHIQARPSSRGPERLHPLVDHRGDGTGRFCIHRDDVHHVPSVRLWPRDRFHALLSVGITTMIISQVALNIAVITGLLPPTGIPLPFFSQGGTNLFVIIVECGLLYRAIVLSSKEGGDE